MITSTDSKGNTTEYTYNVLGLVTNKKVPFFVDNNGNVQYTNYGYTYDAVGNVTKDTVTSGVVNTYTYDYRNRVTQVKSGEQTVDYVYDNVGNIVQYKTGNGTQVHKYEYDSLNRVTKYTDALGNSETYTYDGNQDMIKKVDRNGKAVNYTYDGLHRVLSEKAEGVNNSWTYGLTGGVLTETNDNAVKTYTYNDKGLVHKETVNIDGTAFMTERYYDSRNNIRYNFYRKNGTNYRTVQYNYNVRGLLSAVKENENGGAYENLVSYYYDKNKNLTSAHYGNNTYQVYYYNAANLIHCMDMVDKSDNSKKENLIYRYRLDGNMSGKTETYNGYTITTGYVYDGTGRLTEENVSGHDEFSIKYTYDSTGNRSTTTVSGDPGDYTENYTYDKNNRLISSVKKYGTTSAYTDYTYDKNGNQTKAEKYTKNNEGIFKLGITTALYKNNAGTEKFTYNGLNQLTGYESTNGQYNGKVGLSAEYKYMANGYRLSKSVNGYETRYLWDGDNIVSELNSVNVVSKSYVRGYQLICDSSDNYYMSDIHGNVIEIYGNNSISPDNWYLYSAFGKNGIHSDTDTLNAVNKWGYCGQLYDWETGNYYMRARYYNPDTGRFISEDPIKDGSNWYSYCYNNPIKYTDTSGNVPIETVIDIASIGWSFADFVRDPSLVNFGLLAWDVAAAVIPYAPGSYAVKTLKAGTKIISKADDYVATGVWALNKFDRGWEIERVLGGMCNNFETIDKFVISFTDKKGDNIVNWLSSVTSIKSIDITAKSYQNASTLKRTLTKYVDDLSKYYSKVYKGQLYSLDKGGKKILEIAIPPVEMSKEQARAFSEVASYAKEKGVNVITRIIE